LISRSSRSPNTDTFHPADKSIRTARPPAAAACDMDDPLSRPPRTGIFRRVPKMLSRPATASVTQTGTSRAALTLPDPAARLGAAMRPTIGELIGSSFIPLSLSGLVPYVRCAAARATSANAETPMAPSATRGVGSFCNCSATLDRRAWTRWEPRIASLRGS
jgi:hypothetical protein